MTCLNLTRPASSTVPVLLTLTQPLTAQALIELEHEIAAGGRMAIWCRDLFTAGAGTIPEHAVRRTDAGEIEYNSWLPDPGAIEVASWTSHIRTSVQ